MVAEALALTPEERTRKENGKVIRENIGRGSLGESTEIIDQQDRRLRLNDTVEHRHRGRKI